MTTDETPDTPVTRTRSRAWLWVGAAALLVLAPACWIGAEYALDLEEMAAVRVQVDGVRELVDRTAGDPSDAGEAQACDRAHERLAVLASPPWWRHLAFTLLEQEQVQAASARIAELRQVAAERRANRAWWTEQATSTDAALADEDRTIPDLFALRDRVDSAQPPHPGAGGIAPDAKSGAIARIDADTAALTDAQDRLLRQFESAASLAVQAADAQALDAALAAAPGADTRDLNPPELAMVRQRLNERADAIRAEFAFRAALEASIAGALSGALALDTENASAADAAAIIASIEAIAVPAGTRYAPLVDARSQALDTARRRLALLQARDLDRAWLEEIAAAVPLARTARESQSLLERLQEAPPGGSDLESIARRSGEIAASLRAQLNVRRSQSRRWREDLAGAVDAMVASRTLQAFTASSARVDEVLARDDEDPSASEDAQAERAARAAQRATAARLVRQELEPIADMVSRITDPRQLPPEVAAALAPESPVASVEGAAEILEAIRVRLGARMAEYEAFDGAIDRARASMEAGDLCAAAKALASAEPRTAEQEWMRSDLRGALSELSVETVESLVLGESSFGPGSLGRLERIVQCEELAACAPDAVRMAQRVWDDVRVEADRALWEDCRRTAMGALERRDAATYVGALSRYLASQGAMRDAAHAAREAFAVPVSSVIASEFRWSDGACAPTDPISDITITVDGDTWSGPIATGEPRRAIRLSHEWTVRSGADTVIVSASGVCPCDEPRPFAGLGEISLEARRFGAVLGIRCQDIGTGAGGASHELLVKVVPSVAWLSALTLAPWRAPEELPGDPSGVTTPEQVPPRPESEHEGVSEPTPEAAPQ